MNNTKEMKKELLMDEIRNLSKKIKNIIVGEKNIEELTCYDLKTLANIEGFADALYYGTVNIDLEDYIIILHRCLAGKIDCNELFAPLTIYDEFEDEAIIEIINIEMETIETWK